MPRKDRPFWNDDSPGPDEWRQPQRPPLDERAMLPQDQTFGLPDNDRRLVRPQFDSRPESQAPRPMLDQGPPMNLQAAYPHDRQPRASSSQV